MAQGIVVRSTGSWYTVKTDEGAVVDCKVKGKFRLRGIRSTNPVAVGDRVHITVADDGSAFITEVEERRNYIVRRASNLSKESHIIAANLDAAVLVVTVEHPRTNLVFIDRFLATAEAYNIPVYIAINKCDIYNEDEMELALGIQHLYRTIGYETHLISAHNGEGLDNLSQYITGKLTLFSGNSGVGKSSLINRLIPGLDLKTAALSAQHDTGMHTTTYSQMFPLPQGGYIIDTPGIKGFGTIDFDPATVAHYFPEIFSISHNCRFNNCTHRNEPGCAVLQAIEEHRISQSRYASYLGIIDDSTDGKYRVG
ncbi:MAG: ribosome small subunit-dependent GTPase A [Bacteroidaceae bacterium]|nr:ribosome small subunit-dependent GTPase A [Bacteroidaceae bacterium]